MPFREGGGRGCHVARFYRVGLIGKPSGLDRKRKGARHCRRIASLGNRRVDEHGIETEFHRRRRMGWHADARIDHQRNVGEMRAHGFECVWIVEAASRTDGRAPWHQNLAACLNEPFRNDEIVVHIGKDLKTLVAQNARCFDQPERVRLQGVGVADYFQLDPVRAKNLARHMRRGYCLARRVAARRIGQNGHAKRLDERPEILTGTRFAAFPAQGDGDDPA